MSVIWYLILIILLEVQKRSWLLVKQRCKTNLLTVRYKYDATDNVLLDEAFGTCSAAGTRLTEVAFKFSCCSLNILLRKRATWNEMFSAPPHPTPKGRLRHLAVRLGMYTNSVREGR